MLMIEGTVERVSAWGSRYHELIFSPGPEGLISSIWFHLEDSNVDLDFLKSIKKGERLLIAGTTESTRDEAAHKVYYHGLTKIVRMA